MLHLSVPRLPPLYLPPRARVKVTAVVSGTPLSPISPPLGSCQERRPAVGPPVAVIVTPALGLWAPLGSTAGGSNRMEVEMKPCSVLRGQDIVITFQRRGDHSATPLPIGHAETRRRENPSAERAGFARVEKKVHVVITFP